MDLTLQLTDETQRQYSWWANFVVTVDKQHRSETMSMMWIDLRNSMLREAGAAICRENKETVLTFSSEEDRTLFLLRWS